MYRACIDIGGTFTDCLILDTHGSLRAFKVPTTPQDPSRGMLNALEFAARGYKKNAREFLEQLDLIVHGSTLATNALLTGKGAKVGLLTSKGFRDVLEIRRGYRNVRTSMFNLFIPPYKPLVPRRYRFGIEERTLYTGEIVTPLNDAEVRAAIEKIKKAGLEAVAVCFLHSYANKTNEDRAAAICREMANDLYVTTSYNILPIWREYERFSTTVVSASIGPIADRYLNRLEGALKEKGFAGSLLMVQANGLVETPQESIRRAVYLIGSGPAAAPSAATYCGRTAGKDDLISIDMGGTSLDVSLIRDGAIPMSTESWVGDERVAIKMVDVHSAGAGGGSIAWVDSLGLLRVGPQSAGAEPGPACYGKGGEDPTVTDADLLLGYIPPDYFLGGEISLDVEKARKAVKKVADRLGLDTLRAAQAIHATVNSFMADSITEISTKRGYDVRDFSLIAGGGAGPVHGPALAERLGITTVIIPRFAALYSAFGMFAMDIGRDYARSYNCRVDRVDLDAVNRLYREMEAEGLASMKALKAGKAEVKLARTAEMRYVGQFHEVEVPMASGNLTGRHVKEAVANFHKRHHELYTFSMNQGDRTQGSLPSRDDCRGGTQAGWVAQTQEKLRFQRKVSLHSGIRRGKNPGRQPDPRPGDHRGADHHGGGPAVVPVLRGSIQELHPEEAQVRRRSFWRFHEGGGLV
ncbi:MAG: hydantoinase/oxoprolinase family protein [Deltaproteobacteria bacterium]|nr:hydantoinase/oxoprolinase family protein [Deltaproteobacteria bacterium]